MRALLVTSVHRADDPRIRERTLPSLASAFEVRFATRHPPPSSDNDHEWVELKGGRARRGWAAFRQMMCRDVDVVSLHDPELIPAALVALPYRGPALARTVLFLLPLLGAVAAALAVYKPF